MTTPPDERKAAEGRHGEPMSSTDKPDGWNLPHILRTMAEHDGSTGMTGRKLTALAAADEIDRLRTENAALRERGEKMVELPEIPEMHRITLFNGGGFFVAQLIHFNGGVVCVADNDPILTTPAAALRALPAKLKGANDDA
jgi:hypothetical protein